MLNFKTILVLFGALQCTSNQYLPYHPRPSKPTNICDSSSNTALIEHFFNMIFTEFQTTPPACVCVQMCIDQPTYCYPNGCLKIGESKKKKEDIPQTLRVGQSQEQNGNVASFLVDDHTGFLNTFFSVSGVIKGKSESPQSNVIQRPDPFKDKYKAIFKFRKTPKVHLRYNLREQVKNTKSDVIKIEKIDVSKTKWPTPDRQFFFDSSDSVHLEESDSRLKYPVGDRPSAYGSRFFKRDLGKTKSKIEEKIAQTVEENTEKALNNSFSLENLIENLIESSFGPLQKETELDLNVNLDYAFQTNLTNEPITIPDKRNLLKKNSVIIINETTNVISMNMTNENLDQNRYTEESKETYRNVYNEMIAKLSRNIEKQNNNSMEIMEMYLGRRMDDIETTEVIPDTTIPMTTTVRTDMATEMATKATTENTFETIAALVEEVTETPVVKTSMNKDIFQDTNVKTTNTSTIYLKSRQKINRRQQNSKNN